MKWIDDEIVSSKYKHTRDHKVKYCVYYDKRGPDDWGMYIPKDPIKEFGTEFKNGICFSGLLPLLSRKKTKPNRLYAVIEDDPKNLALTLKEKRVWLNMAKQNKMLPPYFNLSAAKDGIFVLDISDIPPSLLYCYFSTFRFIREDPGFVKAMVYLVGKLKIDFYAAFVLATKICLSHSGHSVTDDVREYMSAKTSPEKTAISMRDVVGLKRFVNDPKKYDNRTLRNGASGSYSSDYNCASSIYTAAEVIANKCTAGLFKTPSFKKVMEASSDEDVQKHLEKAAKEVSNNA